MVMFHCDDAKGRNCTLKSKMKFNSFWILHNMVRREAQPAKNAKLFTAQTPRFEIASCWRSATPELAGSTTSLGAHRPQ